MKKVILAFAFSFFAASAVFAQSEPVQNESETVEATAPVENEAVGVAAQEEGNKTKIEKEELPDKVQSALETGYTEADIKEVYKVESTDGTETTYEVHVDQNGETVKLQYDAEGAPVEQEG